MVLKHRRLNSLDKVRVYLLKMSVSLRLESFDSLTSLYVYYVVQ